MYLLRLTRLGKIQKNSVVSELPTDVDTTAATRRRLFDEDESWFEESWKVSDECTCIS
jgi:hypothetical protein